MNKVLTIHRGFTRKSRICPSGLAVLDSLFLFFILISFTLLTKNSPWPLSSQAMKELKSSQLSVAHGPEEECEDKVHGWSSGGSWLVTGFLPLKYCKRATGRQEKMFSHFLVLPKNKELTKSPVDKCIMSHFTSDFYCTSSCFIGLTPGYLVVFSVSFSLRPNCSINTLALQSWKY